MNETMPSILSKLKLQFNPFEPAATGVPLGSRLSLPKRLNERVAEFLDIAHDGRGVKPLLVVGEYGSGKTCLLRWLHQSIFPSRRVKSYYFDNPGVQFYDLANMLLRAIGRKDFAKFVWELAEPNISSYYQGNIFLKGFEEYLNVPTQRSQRDAITNDLQKAIIKAGVTSDEQIAHCLSRSITEIARKPFFEYRDFMPRLSGAIVPESEEAPYFQAVLKTILRGTNAKSVAFIIDEFEEIGLQKRLSRRASHDYLATMKRLINLSQSEQINFWLILSMTPDAYQTTANLEPALVERFGDEQHRLDVLPLTLDEARDLIAKRIETARIDLKRDKIHSLFPFPPDFKFSENICSNPRRLVKTCYQAIARADKHTILPFSPDYLRSVEEIVCPSQFT